MEHIDPEDRPRRGIRALFHIPRLRPAYAFASVIGRRDLPNMPGTTPDGPQNKLPSMPGTIPDGLRGPLKPRAKPVKEPKRGRGGGADPSDTIEDSAPRLQRGHLSELKPGETGVIANLRGNAQGRLRLMEMGLTPGAHVKVLHAAAFGGPLQISIRGYQLSLRREEASAVVLD